MALLTVDECKSILNLEDNTHNERIQTLIPIVQQDIADYCNNGFDDKVIYRYSGSEFDFVRGSTLIATTRADYIHDAGDGISTAGFKAGMDIVVIGGSNEGFYTIKTASTDTLTLTSTGAIEDQSQTTYYQWSGNIKVARVNWPKPLKVIAAQMIWYLLDDPKPKAVQSERVDDYSVTYIGSHSYPDRVEAGLNKYKRAILI